MRKNFIRKIVTTVIAATTIGSFSSLGVSAATINSNNKDCYNVIVNNLLDTSLIMNNLNGQVTGIKAQVINQVFGSNNSVVNDKTSTLSTPSSNQGTTSNVNTSTTANTTDAVKNTSTNNVENKTTTNTASTSGTSVDVQGLPKLPTNYSITVQAAAEQKILELMNAKRTEAGLKPLTMDNSLLQVARYKSNDMIQNNFFSHTNPDGKKWTNWLQAIGYKYTTTGENIAYNTTDPVELFNQWWNSPGHRANMMNASYTKVGIGVIYGNGKYMGTQEFSN